MNRPALLFVRASSVNAFAAQNIPIDILFRQDRLGHLLVIDGRWQRQLHKYSAHMRVQVERLDALQDLISRRILGQMNMCECEPNLLRRLLLHANVDIAVFAVADLCITWSSMAYVNTFEQLVNLGRLVNYYKLYDGGPKVLTCTTANPGENPACSVLIRLISAATSFLTTLFEVKGASYYRFHKRKAPIAVPVRHT